jgi:assimilatory nitrate reductase catalytic subunit
VGCGVLIRTDGERVRSVRGDPDHPTNRGRLCGKGLRLAETVRNGDRLLRPMLRPATGSGFDRALPAAPATWADAIGAVAGGIRRALAEHGPESIALYLSGQLLTEDYYVANKLAKGLLGTPNVDTNSRLCMASTVAAYRRAFGADGPPGCYEDLDAAHDIVFWGSNARETHPVLFDRLRAAKRPPVRWTAVDPRRTSTAEAADEHVALRPGSDVALTMAMCATLLEEGLVDERRVRATCGGLDELRAAIAAMPAERAAPVCGVPAATIRALARRLASSPAALSLWCQGFNQSTAGTDKVSSLINFHLLSGQLGRPGTGPFSLTGQANAMGGREVGGVATELAAHRGYDDPAGRAEVERYWGLGRVPSGRGLTAVELIEAIERRRVRVLWVACTNPAASLPDGLAVRAALGLLDLLVVQELVHPTETSALADVVLPAAGWAEKLGTLTSSERRVALAERAVDPPGLAMPDWEIFAAVGRALGGGSAFAWTGAAEVFAEHVGLTAGTDMDMTALDHEVLRRHGPQQWPIPELGRPTARRYAGGRYATPDGRARLVAVRFRDPAEEPGGRFPLRLTTARERDQWHTMSRTGRVSALEASDRIVLDVHPDDAVAAGIRDGAEVVVSSPRGSLRAVARATPGIRPGTVCATFHRGPLFEPEGWANALFGRAIDDASFQPELKHTVVRVVPAPERVAVAGGALAEALVAALVARGVDARLLPAGELEEVGPEQARRLLIAEAPVPAGCLPWWRVRAGRRAPPAGAVLDLRAGPEPLGALPALAGAAPRRLGSGGLPPQVLRILDAFVPEAREAPPAGLVVAATPLPVPQVPAGTLVLAPGGRLGLDEPLSGDPERLVRLVTGRGPGTDVVRHTSAALAPGRTLIAIGTSVRDGPGRDDTADLLVHEDERTGTAEVWRLAAGRALGVAAVVTPAGAAEIEAAWSARTPPAALRRRFPLA